MPTHGAQHVEGVNARLMHLLGVKHELHVRDAFEQEAHVLRRGDAAPADAFPQHAQVMPRRALTHPVEPLFQEGDIRGRKMPPHAERPVKDVVRRAERLCRTADVRKHCKRIVRLARGAAEQLRLKLRAQRVHRRDGEVVHVVAHPEGKIRRVFAGRFQKHFAGVQRQLRNVRGGLIRLQLAVIGGA